MSVKKEKYGAADDTELSRLISSKYGDVILYFISCLEVGPCRRTLDSVYLWTRGDASLCGILCSLFIFSSYK